MRIKDAIKFSFNRHMFAWGVVSLILTIIGGVAIPGVSRWIYELVGHSYGWTFGLGVVYSAVLGVVSVPCIKAIFWIVW